MEASLRKKFDAAWLDPAGAVKSWKGKNPGKSIGLLLTDVPFELVHAAQALPVAVLAREIGFQQADRILQGFSCSYSRSLVELVETGELDYLDGLIIPYACDTTRCLDLIFKFAGRFKFIDCLRIPKRSAGDGVKDYYRAELERLAGALSGFVGRPVTAAGLKQSIGAYNRVRERLGRLREGSRDRRIAPSDYFSAVKAAMTLAPEDSVPLLDEAVKAMGSGGPPGNGKPKVVVAGKLPEPFGLIDAIEAAGLRILEDHLVVGGRWVGARVDEGLDPWEGLVARQLNLMPFAGIWDQRPNRASYLIERVKASGADGVVFLVQKFCEIAELDYPGIQEEAQKAGVKLLVLETDFRQAGLEAARTRLQAFAEVLAQGR